MIQVILLILKIIGITILVLLGLILLILALVLFVPVFYRVRVVHNQENTKINGKASFLFPLLNFTFQYLDKFTFRLRVLGFKVVDSEKPPKDKTVKKSKKPKKKKKKKPKKKKVTEPVPKKEMPSDATEASEIKPKVKTSKESVKRPVKEPVNESVKKQGFFEKIGLKLKKIRETISNIIAKIKKLLHQKDEIQRILREPSTRNALKFAWEELKHLLKHILPRKISGYVEYGSDDPATTGQVLGILGIVYAGTGQLVEIRPDFTKAVLTCDVELKGHIQIFTLIVIAVKVFLHQELRQLITEIKNLKDIE